MVGFIFGVHNGKNFIEVRVGEIWWATGSGIFADQEVRETRRQNPKETEKKAEETAKPLRRNKDMEQVKVKLNHLKIPPRKVRILADVIRGLALQEAEAKLMMSPRRPKEALIKTSAFHRGRRQEQLQA